MWAQNHATRPEVAQSITVEVVSQLSLPKNRNFLFCRIIGTYHFALTRLHKTFDRPCLYVSLLLFINLNLYILADP